MTGDPATATAGGGGLRRRVQAASGGTGHTRRGTQSHKTRRVDLAKGEPFHLPWVPPAAPGRSGAGGLCAEDAARTKLAAIGSGGDATNCSQPVERVIALINPILARMDELLPRTIEPMAQSREGLGPYGDRGLRQRGRAAGRGGEAEAICSGCSPNTGLVYLPKPRHITLKTKATRKAQCGNRHAGLTGSPTAGEARCRKRRNHRTLRRASSRTGAAGGGTYPWDSACGPVAKAPDKPPTPTGYAPLLDSTEGPDSTAKGRDRRRNGSRTSLPASGAGV